jgi:citrate synthase
MTEKSVQEKEKPASEGLEGVVALSSDICSIVDGVLRYRGYSIDDLAGTVSFEETVYLLYHKDLPTAAQLAAFRKEIDAEVAVPAGVVQSLRALPKGLHAMAALRTAASLLGNFDRDAESATPEANYRKAVRLQARIGPLVGAYARLREGKEPVEPKPGKSIAWNFLWCLFGKEPTADAEKSIDVALVLHAEHELNASTFAARQVASTLSDIYSAVVAAIGALKGPLHGGANEQVMEMLKKIGDQDVERWLDAALVDKKTRIMGFGHRVYKTGDPRARWLHQMSGRLTKGTPNEGFFKMSERLEQLMKQKKKLLPNVDFYSATTYHALGVPTDLFTPIFVVSRMSGWCAHVLEQLSDNRLIRPRADYVGAPDRTVKPISQRG